MNNLCNQILADVNLVLPSENTVIDMLPAWNIVEGPQKPATYEFNVVASHQTGGCVIETPTYRTTFGAVMLDSIMISRGVEIVHGQNELVGTMDHIGVEEAMAFAAMGGEAQQEYLAGIRLVSVSMLLYGRAKHSEAKPVWAQSLSEMGMMRMDGKYTSRIGWRGSNGKGTAGTLNNGRSPQTCEWLCRNNGPDVSFLGQGCVLLHDVFSGRSGMRSLVL